MSKEVAAAALTQLYFDALQSERSRLTGRSQYDPYAVEAVEEIGTIYGVFLAKLDTFEQKGKGDGK